MLLLVPDIVEEVGREVIAWAWLDGRKVLVGRRDVSRRWGWYRRRDQQCELSEVLGGGSEVELVARAVRPSQSQPIKPQNALEMGEQHLDLFALTARGLVGLGLGDLTRKIARTLVDGARDFAGGRVRTALRLQ